MIIEIVVGVICICDRIVQQVFSKFSMQKRNIHLLKASFRDQITMEVEGNVVKVKMSKFRPTMDFNKVKLDLQSAGSSPILTNKKEVPLML